MKPNYKDPRWQKKRLEILNRDNFACASCCDFENTLHVHHLTYFEGREIWDYDNCWLITLCDICHADEHEKSMVDFSKEFTDKLKKRGFLNWQIEIIGDAFLKMKMETGPSEAWAAAIHYALVEQSHWVYKAYFKSIRSKSKAND